MTREEKIAKLGEILDRYCAWVNKQLQNGMINTLSALHHTQTYGSLMLWCDYNCKAEADEIGRENIWKNFQRCCSITGPDIESCGNYD